MLARSTAVPALRSAGRAVLRDVYVPSDAALRKRFMPFRMADGTRERALNPCLMERRFRVPEEPGLGLLRSKSGRLR